MIEIASGRNGEPLIVHTHVTPWGFAVALPMALAFAYLGALALDAHLVPTGHPSLGDVPLWLVSAVLLVFALALFLIGVAELAAYLKPSVAVVLDGTGITTQGVLGTRRHAWSDVVSAEIAPGQLALRLRSRPGRSPEVRLQFGRLAVEPARLVARLHRHRPDLQLFHRGAEV
ncbi:MAG: hypothetical protein SFW09_21625 [Hyphomicrobiaceae bacterium]|nr:hypothetical protein [Hyphomicrobiaceae bacterium]